MIKVLRFKFIKIAMLSISIVLIIIIGSINLANYINMSNNINTKLELILSNGGTFPEFDKQLHFRDASTEQLNTEMEPPREPDDFSLQIPPNKLHRRGISAESPFDTRYFTVKLNPKGVVKSINTGKIAAISTDTASSYAINLFQQKKDSGYIDCYKYITKTLNSDSTGEASDTLYVFLDCDRELNAFRSFLLASVGISLVGLLVFFLLVFFFSKPMVQPMAESYAKQKRFITDASHEIKTPLTIIDANTEVLEMVAGENEWTQSTRKQIKRLAALTEKLVFLSRMDEEANPPERIEFSLSEAVLDTAEPFAAVAQTHNKSLKIDVSPDISYTGDEGNIRQLVSLLLDNALKYSNDNGSIRISLHTKGHNRILTVWNTVASIEAGSLDHLFDRFYRTDKSRSSETGGFGIGLSVAQAIVVAHKGKISACSKDGASILFTVVLIPHK